LTGGLTVLRITQSGVINILTGEFSEIPLRLLQLERLKNTKQISSLYGIVTKELLLYACNELSEIKWTNCAMERVIAYGYRSDLVIDISSLIGEPKVYHKQPYKGDPITNESPD